MSKRIILLVVVCIFILGLSGNLFAATTPYPWVQSKTNWCWATVSKAMINTRKGGSYSAPSSYTPYNNQTGVRTSYCYYNGTIYVVDKLQEYIVRTYKAAGTSFTGTNKDNLGGTYLEIKNAVAGQTGYTVGYYGEPGEHDLSDVTARTTYIDVKLVTDSKEIIANAYSSDKSKNHSLLVTNKTDTGNYKTWNPWYNSYVTYTPSELFTNGISPSPYTTSTLYVDNVVYFS